MGQWADFLVKRQISETLLAGIEDRVTLTDDERAQLAARYERSEDMRPLRAAAKAMKTRLPRELASELSKEIREIGEDLRYAQTDIGKTALTINAWLESWYQERIRSDRSFDDVMISGNADDPFKVYVIGEVASGAELERLRSLVDEQNPPFEVMFQARVKA